MIKIGYNKFLSKNLPDTIQRSTFLEMSENPVEYI